MGGDILGEEMKEKYVKYFLEHPEEYEKWQKQDYKSFLQLKVIPFFSLSLFTLLLVLSYCSYREEIIQ